MTIKTNNYQVGIDPTAANNFALQTPAAPDGTMKLARGLPGATTQDILTVDALGRVQFPGGLQATSLGVVNRIRNSRMLINQRVAASVTADNAHIVDGWKLRNLGTARLTGSQINVQSLPSNSAARLQVTGATGIATGDYFAFQQAIEGTLMADLGWGAAGGVGILVSLRVRSSVPGTYAVAIRDSASTVSYTTPITINAANTFEDKVVYVPAPTIGTWPIDTTIGAVFSLTASVGTTYSTGVLNTWQAGNFPGISSQTLLTNTANATMDLALVQIEPAPYGPTQPASPYVWMAFADELRSAQRYFFSSYDYGSLPGSITGNSAFVFSGISTIDAVGMQTFPVEMRAYPTTVGIWNPTGAANSMRNMSSGAAVTVTSLLYSSRKPATINSSGLATNTCYNVQFQCTAEL